MYLGCWFPTATKGVRDINERYSVQSATKAPLLLVRDVYESITRFGMPITVVVKRTRTYYFWFFGWSAELFTTHGYVNQPPGIIPAGSPPRLKSRFRIEKRPAVLPDSTPKPIIG